MAKLKLFSRSSTGTSASTVTSLAESTAPSATTRATSLGPDPCASCKTLNRKCNGGRPSCGYCQSESLQCDYGGESSSRRASQRTTTNSQHTPSELLDYRRPRVELKITEFPVAYFLDGNVFNRSEQRIPNADLTLPDYVRDLIPNAATVKNIASQYFATVHTYMPIISKGRFFTVLMNPLLQPRTDVGLLLLCMQLIILPPSDKVPMKMVPEYVAAKEFYTEIEAAGTCSIQVMQAGILIALYEFGHAIYPQAYFSVGACARYGVAYGMDDIYMDVPSSEDWVEEEERKRVWWAVLMLDRCMNMGKPIRALLTLEPHPSCTLPMDDDAWDNEVLDPEVFQLFSPSSANMGKFAQMAKATYLLGRVFAHACDAVTEESFGGEQAAELKTTLRALINLTDVEGPNREIENSAESAMCFSGLLILQECYGPLIGELSNTLKDVEHEIVNTGIDKGVAAEITKTSQAFMAESGHHIGTVSPFAFHALYASAAISMEAGRISGSEDDFKQGRIVTKFLKLLGRRWKSAGAYLELLERKETLYYS